MADQLRPDGEGDRPVQSGRPRGAGDGQERQSGGRPAPSGQGRPAAGDRAVRPERSGSAPDDGRGRSRGSGRPGGGGARPAGAPRGGPGAGGARREQIEQRTYDPRREERRRAARVPLPDDVDPRMLDRDVRQELRSLSKETAELVARHLVVAGRLMDDEPETALVHARAARALAGRVGPVREAAGLAAYAAGEWAEALTELRAARRISGSPEHMAVMADCERALDRPERALGYADDPDVSRLEQAARVELVIVLSGARRDMGQAGAAVLELQDPARRTKANRPWAARLWYAYADALLAAGREEQAREWFVAAADLDADGQTDAAERLLELDGVVFEEVDEGLGPDDAVASEAVAAAPSQAPSQGSVQVPAEEPASEDDACDQVTAQAGPGPVAAPSAADDAAARTSEQTSPASGAVPAVSFQAPESGDELRLFD